MATPQVGSGDKASQDALDALVAASNKLQKELDAAKARSERLQERIKAAEAAAAAAAAAAEPQPVSGARVFATPARRGALRTRCRALLGPRIPALDGAHQNCPSILPGRLVSRAGPPIVAGGLDHRRTALAQGMHANAVKHAKAQVAARDEQVRGGLGISVAIATKPPNVPQHWICSS
jgi:hypothetical protein